MNGTASKLSALKQKLSDLDLTGEARIYSGIYKVNYFDAHGLSERLKGYLFLVAKFPDRALPPSFAMEQFWRLITKNNKYESFRKDLLNSIGIELPAFKGYFFGEKYLNRQDLENYKNFTAPLFENELGIKLSVRDAQGGSRLTKVFTFIKNNMYGISTLFATTGVLTAIIGHHVNLVDNTNKKTRNIYQALDSTVRALTYEDENIYILCDTSKGTISAANLNGIVYQARAKLLQSYINFLLAFRVQIDSGTVDRDLFIVSLKPITDYNDQLLESGMRVCEMKWLKGQKEIQNMRRGAAKLIGGAGTKKILNYFDVAR